ncbi:MAG: hypothetical protein J6K89_05455, partial [Oscillospiraceae bacterium]|nr:hypothetical protein [Oscillospiraceae bacterium]
TSNNDGTHKITCSRCSYSASENCGLVDNVCPDCGYTVEPELPEDPEVPVGELTAGKYVIAANVDGVYYAMSNTFANKIAGTEITVTNGKVAAADAEGYVIVLEEADGGWTISDGNGNYLKYSSSTNLANSTTAYAWAISEGTNGTWRVAAQTSGRGLIFRAKTYNQFGGYNPSNCTAGSAEYFDVEFLPVEGASAPAEPFSIKLGHSLNLASDISINYAVTTTALDGYSNYYLECKIPTYEGNTQTGTTTVTIQPVLTGNYYYFTMNGMTAVQMNDIIESTLYATKDGKLYASEVDTYSVATYAYNTLIKSGSTEELKTLCVDLLRYGAKAQLFKGYRTNALADANLTAEQQAMLTDLESVSFGNVKEEQQDCSNIKIAWVGRGLDLQSKVTVRFIVKLAGYTGDVSDLSLKINYTDITGKAVTATLDNAILYNPTEGYYAFDFDGLLAAELRSVLSAAVYADGAQVSNTMRYSADTYGNGKEGTLLTLCQALFAYSDSAKAYFTN